MNDDLGEVTVTLPVAELGAFLDRGDNADYILGLLHEQLWAHCRPGEPLSPSGPIWRPRNG